MLAPQTMSTIGIIRDTTYISAMTACAAGGIGVALWKSLVEKYSELYFGKQASKPFKLAGHIIESTSLGSIELIESLLTKGIKTTDLWFHRVGIQVNGELLRCLKSVSSPEVYETLLVVTNFLKNLNDQGTIRQLVKGLKILSTLHSTESFQNQIHISESSELPTISAVEKWEHGFMCAVTACGWRVLRLLGLTKASDNVSMAKELAGITEIKIWEDSATFCRPAHYVGINHDKKFVIVSFRGTMQFEDLITDLVCEQAEFSTFLREEYGSIIRGKAHSGFLRAALSLANSLRETVEESLRTNSEYNLLLTGHSLGAGVATLLTLIWAQEPFFRNANIKCIAFGAPCSLSKELALAPFTKKYVEAVTLDDDFVSRLSLGSVTELSRLALLLSETDNEDLDSHRAIACQAIEEVEQLKLFPGGTVWHLPSYSVKCSTHFARIKLSPSMFSVHMPTRYLAEIIKLKTLITKRKECPVQ